MTIPQFVYLLYYWVVSKLSCLSLGYPKRRPQDWFGCGHFIWECFPWEQVCRPGRVKLKRRGGHRIDILLTTPKVSCCSVPSVSPKGPSEMRFRPVYQGEPKWKHLIIACWLLSPIDQRLSHQHKFSCSLRSFMHEFSRRIPSQRGCIAGSQVYMMQALGKALLYRLYLQKPKPAWNQL